jgi:hypothetical protein
MGSLTIRITWPHLNLPRIAAKYTSYRSHHHATTSSMDLEYNLNSTSMRLLKPSLQNIFLARQSSEVKVLRRT